MRQQHDGAGRRVDLRVVQRAPHPPSPRDAGDVDRGAHARRPHDAYDGIHPAYVPGLPIHTALRHPARSPGCPYLLRLLMILICSCTCLFAVVGGTMTMAVVLPFGGSVGNEHLLGELRAGAVRRAVSSFGVRGGHRLPATSVVPPRPLRPPRPPPLSPSPSPPPEDREDEPRPADEMWRRASIVARAPEELLGVLDELVATADDGDRSSAGLDWGRAVASLPEWRQEGAYDEPDERIVLGDLVRLVRHLHAVARAQHDELRNLTRAATSRRRTRSGSGPRAEPVALRSDAAHNRTTNESVHALH